MNVYKFSDTDRSFYQRDTLPRRRGNPGTRKAKSSYKNVIAAFDIETTRIPYKDDDITFMYIWQLAFGEDTVVYGRDWSEARLLFKWLADNCKPQEKYVIYIHNLSYEFQFLRGIYEFSPEEVFAVKSRKILKCEMYGSIEFRCSYLHSNMSLAEFTKKMKVKHQKLDGDEFNYNKIRYPWTPLTARELEYTFNDVIGLVEALQTEMVFDGDDLYTIPLTSTGYVRRDAKRAMQHTPAEYIREQYPSYTTYKMLREAFRGGNCHANRYYAGEIIENVKSADRSSSYPDVICNCEYPISPFVETPNPTVDLLHTYVFRFHRAAIMRVAFKGVSLTHSWWGCPYLSKDKCRNIINGKFDNGRILSADYLETTLTDIDFRIVVSEYSFQSTGILQLQTARYGKLPPALIKVVQNYYTKKTELKDVPGQDIFYMKSKNKLNSIYGMMAQDPVKLSILFKDQMFQKSDDDPAELLEAGRERAFLVYQWGVWTTAWARYRLEEGIALAGKHFIYADTDSVKYIGDIDWDKYNSDRIYDSEKTGSLATDPNGITHHMGVYEQERSYATFKTLGAKKYAYTYEQDGPTHVTISGVMKKKGGKELDKHNGLESFAEGFIFSEAGGNELEYVDNPSFSYLPVNCTDGKTRYIEITPYVNIIPSTYTLGITDEYDSLLKECVSLIEEEKYNEKIFQSTGTKERN